MKAISLWQPWASLWLTHRKVHETRHWATSHRGWLAVHAAKKIEKDVSSALRSILVEEFGHRWLNDLPTGAIIGAVDLVSCLQMNETNSVHYSDRECGNWSDERFAWRRGDIIKLAEPIPYRGMQGIFTLPDAVARQVLNPTVAA